MQFCAGSVLYLYSLPPITSIIIIWQQLQCNPPLALLWDTSSPFIFRICEKWCNSSGIEEPGQRQTEGRRQQRRQRITLNNTLDCHVVRHQNVKSAQ